MKKGFTIIELIVSISLLLLVSTLVAFGLVEMSDKQRAKLYQNKIDLILIASEEYANDHLDELGSTCTNIQVRDLIEEGYLNVEGDDTIRDPGDDTIRDPRNNSSMEDICICLKYENKIKVELCE